MITRACWCAAGWTCAAPDELAIAAPISDDRRRARSALALIATVADE
jgi:hypothetical protein